MKNKLYLNGVFGLIAAFSIGLIGTAAADKDNDRRNDNSRQSAQDEIKELMSCYAYSFDAIARAVTATNPVPYPFNYLDPINNSDPHFAEGLERFSNCTTEDWSVEVATIDGTVLLSPGDIPPGALPFVNLINNLARAAGQTNTQHLYGSLSSTANGTHGTLKAYAIIHTTVDGTGGNPAGTTSGTSTYTSDVVFRHGKWLLQKTTFVVN